MAGRAKSIIPAPRGPVGLRPKPNLYYNPSGEPFDPQGGSDANRTYPYRQPLFNPAGGIPQEQGGYKSHSIILTSQQFSIPEDTTAYVADGSLAGSTGTLGNIILRNIVPFGRYLLIPRIWNINAYTQIPGSGDGVSVSFVQSITAQLRFTNPKTGATIVLWSYTALFQGTQVFGGIDLPLPSLKSDFLVSFSEESDNFNGMELTYSIVFSNSGTVIPLPGYVNSMFQYDVVEVQQDGPR